MGSYSGSIGRPGRTKAIVAVVAVHVALAFIILTGLNVHAIRRAVEQMTTINIAEPPPPPPVNPPPADRPDKAKLEEGAAGKKDEPTPVVAPEPKIPVETPVPAAKVAGTGSATNAGATTSGTGTGAGGSGSGRGGGGTGDFSRFTPARLIRNLDHRDYASLAGGRLPVGSADFAISVSSDGSVGDCRLLRSSGDPVIDRGLCPLIRQRLRFRPALDDQGRRIIYRTNYRATWRLGY